MVKVLMAERKVFTTLVFVRIFYLISRDLQEFIWRAAAAAAAGAAAQRGLGSSDWLIG